MLIFHTLNKINMSYCKLPELSLSNAWKTLMRLSSPSESCCFRADCSFCFTPILITLIIFRIDQIRSDKMR